MTTDGRWSRVARWDWRVIGLVGVCVALRWWLVFAGGQYWFPDEKRFWWSGVVVYRLSQGLWKSALEPILQWNQHPGFTCLGCVPVAMHWAWAKLTGLSVGEMPFAETVRFSAAVLSLASVMSILLIRTIVRRAGGNRTEAFLAMALLAGSNTMFYYSRHVLPYDASMALALGSMAVGMRRGGWRRLLVSGWLAGAAFMTYYGYWALVVAVSGAVVMWNADTITAVCRRLLWFGAGALLWVVVFAMASVMIFGQSFLGGMISFAGILPPKLYGEGWSAPWAYLWHAEHGLLFIWLAAVAAILWIAVKRRQSANYGMAWVTMAAALYLQFVISSVVLHKFVVYGRTARQLVPFLCLSAAFAGARFLDNVRPETGQRILKLALIALAMQALWNFRTPLEQWFPDQVKRIVAAQYGAVSQALTVEGPTIEDEGAVPGSAAPRGRYVLVDAQYLARFSGVKAPPPGAVLLRFPHPEQFKPYQYEEFTPSQREILRHTDISIRLVDTAVEHGLAHPPTIP